ncbi:flagellin N-terminal helical domain-containing protein [Marinococcus halophilus]|uniref:flagellin N-terminal helical domain-containing protein n=1 Tax=Marinococcus halophilus TaxID=1371 RepID=UPI0009A764D7|nr:flagellin [Marinococcus halophilus]
MIINHNLGAMNAQRQMSANQNNMSNSMEKLSSGLRINRAGDDAAGLAISEKMRGQIRGLEQANRNAQDGVSMIQTAEGALNETHSILQRQRELAVQASNDTNTQTDREEIQKEFDQLAEEIDRISGQTEFNTKKLLAGGEGAGGSSFGTTDTNLGAALTQTTGEAADSISLKQENAYAADGSVTSVTFTAEDGDGNTDNITINVGDLSTSTSETLTVNGVDYTLDASGANVDADATKDATDTAVEIGVDEYTNTASAGGSNEASFSFQIGANTNQNMDLTIKKMDTSTLGSASEEISTLVSDQGTVNGALTTQQGANDAIASLDKAIQQVSAERSQLGANQNRLEHTINNLGTSAENLQSAESRIRDVDMAKEMMNMTKNNILSQASQSMLAQANQQPQSVLQLLQ